MVIIKYIFLSLQTVTAKKAIPDYNACKIFPVLDLVLTCTTYIIHFYICSTFVLFVSLFVSFVLHPLSDS